jgi:hypothetical protein
VDSSGLSRGERALRHKLRTDIVQTAEAEGLELNNQQIDERIDRAMNRRDVRSLHPFLRRHC